MKKYIFKSLLIMAVAILFSMPISNGTIIKNENDWFTFPSKLSKSMFTNWDNYYEWSGNITKKIESENITYKIQTYGILQEKIDEIQVESDKTPDDTEFYAWLNEYISQFIDETAWNDFSGTEISVECKLGDNVKHDHLIFIKVNDNGKENIIWQGYGSGFSRLAENREKKKNEQKIEEEKKEEENKEEDKKEENNGIVTPEKDKTEKENEEPINKTIINDAENKDNNTTVKDESIATGKLPYTGKSEIFIAIISIVFLTGLISLFKYKKM